MKILTFHKAHLKAAAHIKIMQRMAERAGALTAADLSDCIGAIQAYEAFCKAVRKEEADFGRMAKSELTQQIADADKRRDRAYSTIKQVAGIFGKSQSPEHAEAARKVLEVIDRYKLKTSSQLDEESGTIAQLLDDLDHQFAGTDDLHLLGLGLYFDELRQASALVDQLLDQRDEERASLEKSAMRADRQATDAAYNHFVEYINALMLVHPNPALQQFVSQWNAVVNRVRVQMLNQSSVSSADTADIDL